MFKPRDFNGDIVNNYMIRDKEELFRTFIDSFKIRVVQVDEKIKQLKRQKEDEGAVKDKYLDLKASVETMVQKAKQAKLQGLPFEDFESEAQKMEYDLYLLNEELTKLQLKKEAQARKKTQVEQFKEEAECVFFHNIQRMVNPQSEGARVAQKMEVTNILDANFEARFRQTQQNAMGGLEGVTVAGTKRKEI